MLADECKSGLSIFEQTFDYGQVNGLQEQYHDIGMLDSGLNCALIDNVRDISVILVL
jgi:hypothetical protein